MTPKSVPKINLQNLSMLAIVLIGSFIVYRVISSIQKQIHGLKLEFESHIKLSQSNPVQDKSINVFEKTAADAPVDDDDASVNSYEIDHIMKKLNDSEVDADEIVNEQPLDNIGDSDATVSPVDSADNDPLVESPDDATVGSTSLDLTELRAKSLIDLKELVKSQGKIVKGNKSDLIKLILE